MYKVFRNSKQKLKSKSSQPKRTAKQPSLNHWVNLSPEYSKEGVLNASPSVPRILLVEDSPIVLMVIESYVKGFGYSYDVSQTALDAIAKLKSHTYAMIITDLGLPDLSGQILAKTVRRMEEDRDQSARVIIGLTASVDT